MDTMSARFRGRAINSRGFFGVTDRSSGTSHLPCLRITCPRVAGKNEMERLVGSRSNETF